MKLERSRVFATLLPIFVVIGSVLNMFASSHIEAHGLPKYGVDLISQDNPTFDVALRSLLHGKHPDLGDKLRRVSVLVQNRSEHVIVGYCLRWELMDATGNTTSRGVIYVEPSALRDGQNLKYGSKGKFLGSKIHPGAVRLVWLAGTLDEFSPPGALASIPANKEFEDLTNAVSASIKTTVSIDGILFDDGRFVGPDSYGSFDRITATFRGEQDFFYDVVTRVDKGEAEAAVMARVRDTLLGSEQVEGPSPAQAPERDYHSAEHSRAEEFTNIAQKSGFEAAVQHCRALLYNTVPNFRREE